MERKPRAALISSRLPWAIIVRPFRAFCLASRKSVKWTRSLPLARPCGPSTSPNSLRRFPNGSSRVKTFASPRLCSAISRYRHVLRRFFRQGSGTGVSPVCSSKGVACYRNTRARRPCHFAGHVPLVAALPRYAFALNNSRWCQTITRDGHQEGAAVRFDVARFYSTV